MNAYRDRLVNLTESRDAVGAEERKRAERERKRTHEVIISTVKSVSCFLMVVEKFGPLTTEK
jgi:hypothetical protein